MQMEVWNGFQENSLQMDFLYEYGLDYSETFGQFIMYLAVVTLAKMKIIKFDVKNEFSYGILNEELHMSQPFGFNDGTG